VLEFTLKNTPLYLKQYRKLNSEGEYYSLTHIVRIISEDYPYIDMLLIR